MFKSKSKSELLQDIYVAAPCKFGWDNMRGDEKVRFCPGCSQNVYNVSEMTEKEAIKFASSDEGLAACIRLYRRTDGTLITKDCPVGLRELRNIWKRHRQVASAILLTLIPFGSVRGEELQAQTKGKEEPRRDVNLFDVSPRIYDGGRPMSSGPAIAPADRGASNLLREAQANEQHNPAIAEATYKKALDAAKTSNGDLNFARAIARCYAMFLKRLGRQSEALKIQDQYNVTDSFRYEPQPCSPVK
jgi:hypothetical protein